MEIEIKSVKNAGSCNFCRRGKGDWGKKTNYPYAQVYEVKGNTIGFRMCGHCRKEFIDKILRLPLLQDQEKRRGDCD